MENQKSRVSGLLAGEGPPTSPSHLRGSARLAHGLHRPGTRQTSMGSGLWQAHMPDTERRMDPLSEFLGFLVPR